MLLQSESRVACFQPDCYRHRLLGNRRIYPPIRRNREKHGRTGLSISGQGEKRNVGHIHLLPNRYKFDANKLHEWGFQDKKLPFNSLIINQQVPFFQAYRTEVQFILFTFLVLIGGLFISLYYY